MEGSAAVLAASILGAVLACGLAAAWCIGRSRPRAGPSRGLPGTLAVVATAIPRGGVGRVTHASRGHFARIPAREVSGAALAAGTPVVIVELARGVASVTALPPDLKETFE